MRTRLFFLCCIIVVASILTKVLDAFFGFIITVTDLKEEVGLDLCEYGDRPYL